MAQGVFDFQYEVEKKSGGMTGLAGLPPYLEFGYVMGLGAAIGNRLKIRGGDQGWSDEQVVMALILLNLAGGDCVSDLRVLAGDDGFCRILKGIERQGSFSQGAQSSSAPFTQRWYKGFSFSVFCVSVFELVS